MTIAALRVTPSLPSCGDPDCSLANPPIRDDAGNDSNQFAEYFDGTPIERDPFAAYFNRTPVKCWACPRPMDLWKRCMQLVESESEHNQGASMVGVVHGDTGFDLHAHERITLDVHALGVPVDAQILSVSLHPIALHPWVEPLLLANGTRVRYRRPLDAAFEVYGVPHGDPVKPTYVRCDVEWQRPALRDTPAWSHLFDAWGSFASNDYGACVVSASIAAEIAIEAALVEIVGPAAGRPVYSSQLQDELPKLWQGHRIPAVDPKIVHLLLAANKQRNAVVHNGTLDVGVSRGDVAQYLSAATFGFRYARFAQQTHRTRNLATGGAVP